MNKKGFTLIELLAVIVIIALIGVLIAPNVINTLESGKESSYKILINNIVTAAKTYYEECEYGDLSDNTKYGEYACQINNNNIDTTLGALANTGILSVKDTNDNQKVVKDPRNNNNLTTCPITITKTKTEETDENGITSLQITYTVEPAKSTTTSSENNCPTKYGSTN